LNAVLNVAYFQDSTTLIDLIERHRQDPLQFYYVLSTMSQSGGLSIHDCCCGSRLAETICWSSKMLRNSKLSDFSVKETI